MATLNSQQQEDLALSAAYEDDTPTPPGWTRKLVPRIGKGLTPARTDVIFIASDGEEFKTKTQLQQYLKSNKGGPAISEFIWIADETPRRSSRLTSKTPIKITKVESPPKATSKQKPAREVPLEESKVGKHRYTEKAESPVEERKVGKGKRTSPVEEQKVGKGKRTSPVEELKVGKGKRTKKADKVAPIESKDEGISPSASGAKAKKKRSVKDVKKTKGAQAGTKSIKANGGTQMSKTDENVEEETMEESISYEPNKEEPAKTNHSQNGKGDKDENIEGPTNETIEDPVGLEEVDGGDRTMASMLGSDPVAEVMEAQSETLESDEDGRALEGTDQDCEKASMMHQENHLAEAAMETNN